MTNHTSHRGHWSNGAQGGPLPKADQVVLGHLLPQYQAALDWQTTVRSCRIIESSFLDRTPPAPAGIISFLGDAIRSWRRRQWASSTITPHRVMSFAASLAARSRRQPL